jgi:hypothetical protein
MRGAGAHETADRICADLAAPAARHSRCARR